MVWICRAARVHGGFLRVNGLCAVLGATAVAPPGRLVQRVVRTGALARISVGSVVGPRGDGEEEGS